MKNAKYAILTAEHVAYRQITSNFKNHQKKQYPAKFRHNQCVTDQCARAKINAGQE